MRRHQGAVVAGELRAAELAQLAGAANRAVVDLTAMIRFDSRLNFSICSTLEVYQARSTLADILCIILGM